MTRYSCRWSCAVKTKQGFSEWSLEVACIVNLVGPRAGLYTSSLEAYSAWKPASKLSNYSPPGIYLFHTQRARRASYDLWISDLSFFIPNHSMLFPKVHQMLEDKNTISCADVMWKRQFSSGIIASCSAVDLGQSFLWAVNHSWESITHNLGQTFGHKNNKCRKHLVNISDLFPSILLDMRNVSSIPYLIFTSIFWF